MSAAVFASKLSRNGYSEVRTNNSQMRLYAKIIDGQRVVVGIIDCHGECPVTGFRLAAVGNNIEDLLSTGNVLFVVFTDNSYETRCKLSGDNRHWIFNEITGQVEIYDDQPGEFFDVQAIIEQKNPSIFSRASICTVALCIINLVMYFVTESIGVEWGTISPGQLFDEHEYFRLLTSMFIHFNVSHIVGNMICLYFLGDALERIVGRLKFAIIYMGSGIVGGVISQWYYAYTNHTNVMCAGASGAIFGITGAILMLVIVNKGRISTFNIRQVVLYIALSIYAGVQSTGVSVSAHVGGLIGGFLITGLLLLCKKRGFRT